MKVCRAFGRGEGVLVIGCCVASCARLGLCSLAAHRVQLVGLFSRSLPGWCKVSSKAGVPLRGYTREGTVQLPLGSTFLLPATWASAGQVKAWQRPSSGSAD